MTVMTLTPRIYRFAGIDPGAYTGLVALSVRAHAGKPLTRVISADADSVRWIGAARVHAGAQQHYTDAENEARTYYTRVRAQLLAWRVTHVALEEPWDNVPVRLQEQGTAFTLGARYGLALAAAHSIGARCMSYPVTSAPAKVFTSDKRSTRTRPARVGWMPQVRGGKRNHLLMTQDRTITLRQQDDASRVLRLRPDDGMLQYTNMRDMPTLSEDELMALGVLSFHLTHQPYLTE